MVYVIVKLKPYIKGGIDSHQSHSMCSISIVYFLFVFHSNPHNLFIPLLKKNSNFSCVVWLTANFENFGICS